MAGQRCFLCAKRGNSEFESIKSRVPASQKPIQVVLQHLANCIKTDLKFQEGTRVCQNCFKELAVYDNLMLNLLTSQKRLTQQLQNILKSKVDVADIEETHNDMDFVAMTIEEEVDESPLADAFNPELDAKEELIEVDDEIINDDTTDHDELDDDEDDNEITEVEWPIGRRRISTIQECAECGEIFKSKYQLQNHISEKHKANTFACNICGHISRDEEYLELHMNTHEGKTENECRYCDKRFSRRVNTLRHMRKHWDKKKFQCEKCGERFSLDNMLYNHRLRHEAEENPLICSICNQSFKSRKTFNHHVLIHQENRPRHHCSLCSKSFTERYTLKMHMKTHGEEVSSTSTNMRTFNAVEERLETETVAAVTSLVDEEVESEIYSCVICSTKFDIKESLETHLQRDHDVILK